MSGLVDRERALAASLGPSEAAKRVAPSLIEIANEIKLRARTETEKELAALDAERLTQAADLLRVLETEQFRQRETIKLYLHGRVDSAALRRVSESWNMDPSHD